jgi:hypothetical protein
MHALSSLPAALFPLHSCPISLNCDGRGSNKLRGESKNIFPCPETAAAAMHGAAQRVALIAIGKNWCLESAREIVKNWDFCIVHTNMQKFTSQTAIYGYNIIFRKSGLVVNTVVAALGRCIEG